MNKHRWIFSLPLIAALSLLGVLVMSSPVHAQDEQPLQPGDTPVEVVFDSVPAEQQDEESPQPGEVPVEVIVDTTLPEQQEESPSQAPDNPLVVIPGEESAIVDPTEETTPAEEVTVEIVTEELAPMLETAADAGVTLVDSKGQPMALALEATAEALASGDPYYTVGAVTYRFLKTGGDCSPYPVGTCWTSATPIQAAIAHIPTSGLPSNGLIYVEADIYTENIIVDSDINPIYKGLKGLIGEMVGEIPLVNLTGTISINAVDLGFTIKGFNVTANAGDPGAGISITNSKGAVKIEDVTVTNSGEGPGIKITNHNGALTLNRVKADKNKGGGSWLENLAGTAGVTITNSSFDENDINAGMSLQGATISTKGAVLIDGVSISRTTGSQPALLINQSGSIIIRNSIFNDNTEFFAIANNLPGSPTASITLQNVYAIGNAAGLHLQAKGNISLIAVHADENASQGAEIDTCNEVLGACISLGSGMVTIKDSTFNENSSSVYGLSVQSRGAITLTNVSASGNTSGSGNPDGARLENQYSQTISPVSITNGLFNDNDAYGLMVNSKGAITLNKVHVGDAVMDPYTTRGNGAGGAQLINNLGTGYVTITGTAPGDNTFSFNSGAGLDIISNGKVTINNTFSDSNSSAGLSVTNDSGTGAVIISKSSLRKMHSWECR